MSLGDVQNMTSENQKSRKSTSQETYFDLILKHFCHFFDGDSEDEQ